ncbi:hypothetical protein METROID_235 [Staphylococcus phage Metroid]|nr:hypothetical protein METROID_4 [Staphylococcus phage Metroid]QKE56284.1 hypothetical protein METROID_235 [Staphylococcus phage Metroid]
MIEIRLDKNYSDFVLKFTLKIIKDRAPRELTYGMEADIDTVDVNIEDVNPYRDYKHTSEIDDSDLFMIVRPSGYDAYYQGESYRGESLDEIIHDMFYDDADPFDLDY